MRSRLNYCCRKSVSLSRTFLPLRVSTTNSYHTFSFCSHGRTLPDEIEMALPVAKISNLVTLPPHARSHISAPTIPTSVFILLAYHRLDVVSILLIFRERRSSCQNRLFPNSVNVLDSQLLPPSDLSPQFLFLVYIVTAFVRLSNFLCTITA